MVISPPCLCVNIMKVYRQIKKARDGNRTRSALFVLMLQYWYSENDGFSTYSVDMVRYSFTCSDSNLSKIMRWLERSERTDVESFGLSTSPFKYRNLFKINYKYSSMIIGLGFNGITKEAMHKCFVEFNPNKVFQNRHAFDDLSFLVDYSQRFKLNRFDIAIDLPIVRNLVQLVKDERKYGLTMYSADNKTEYLGCRNENGYIKLYNKTIESNLNYDVTRLEITCDSQMSGSLIVHSLPRLLVSPTQNSLTLDVKLSPKDRLLVDLLKMNPEMFSRLDYRNRLKFEPYVFDKSYDLKFSSFCIDKLVKHLHSFEK